MAMMKHALVAGSLSLLVGTTVGCGGRAPTDASVAEFCGAHKSLLSINAAQEMSPSGALEAAGEWGEALADVGTPEDIPDQARKGFEVTVRNLEILGDLDPDNPEESLEDVTKPSAEDMMAVNVYTQYVSTTCPVDASDLELLQ